MERGPMALFGAIIAVGLGPAMWLGAQFGGVDVTPTQPTTTSIVDEARAPGGTGAGAEPDKGPRVLDADADTDADRPPLTVVEPSARPQRTTAPVRTSTPTEAPPTSSSPGAEPSASSSAPVSEPPTESTDEPGPTAPTAGADREPVIEAPLSVGITLAERHVGSSR
jgi:hypothetical protein